MDDMDRENQGEGEGLMDKAKQAIGGLFGGGEKDTAPSDVRDMSGTAATDSYATETNVGTTGGGMGGYDETTNLSTSGVTEGMGTSDVGVGGDFGRGTGGTSGYGTDTGTTEDFDTSDTGTTGGFGTSDTGATGGFSTSDTGTTGSSDYGFGNTDRTTDTSTSDYGTEVETRSIRPTEFGTSGGSADPGVFGTDAETSDNVDSSDITQGVASEREESRGRF